LKARESDFDWLLIYQTNEIKYRSEILACGAFDLVNLPLEKIKGLG